MSKKYLLVMLFCSLLHFSWAQRTITGTVTEADSGMPVPSANVIEKGTLNGVLTNFDGEFTIEVPLDAVLEVSYFGLCHRKH